MAGKVFNNVMKIEQERKSHPNSFYVTKYPNKEMKDLYFPIVNFPFPNV